MPTAGQQTYNEDKKIDITIDFNKLAREKAGIIYQLKQIEEEKRKLQEEQQKAALQKILAMAEVQTQLQDLYSLAGKLQLQQQLLDAKLAASEILPTIKKKTGELPILDNAPPMPKPKPMPVGNDMPNVPMPPEPQGPGMPPPNLPPTMPGGDLPPAPGPGMGGSDVPLRPPLNAMPGMMGGGGQGGPLPPPPGIM